MIANLFVTFHNKIDGYLKFNAHDAASKDRFSKTRASPLLISFK